MELIYRGAPTVSQLELITLSLLGAGVRPENIKDDRFRLTISIEQEETPVRKNLTVSGDDSWDRRCENRVLKRLKDGDTLAWFTACLSLESWSTEVLHKTYLGCCNYDSPAEFIQDQMECLLAEAVDEFAELVLSAHDNKAA